MKSWRRVSTFSVGIFVAIGLHVIPAAAANDPTVFRLTGLQEVPAVITSGIGRARVRVRGNQNRIQVRMNYANLGGNITQAHLHLGQSGVNGGVMAWICADPSGPAAGSAPVGTAACTGTDGRVAVDIMSDSVVGPAAQGIDTGNLTVVMEAVRSGVAYINVHSSRFPAGELRGQVPPAGHHGSGDLEDRIDELEDDLKGHSHAYRTGKGKGHNNSSAQTGRAKF